MQVGLHVVSVIFDRFKSKLSGMTDTGSVIHYKVS
jgi:hypothetical protein